MAIQDYQEIIVLDTELRSIGSHHFQYDDSIARGADALGVRMQIFAHRDIAPEVLRKLPVTPAFADLLDLQRRVSRAWPFRAWPQMAGMLLYLLENIWRGRELARLLRRLDLTDRLLLVPTCGPIFSAALARTLAKRLTGRSRAVLVFHYPPDRVTSRMAIRTLLPLVRKGKFIPAVTNEVLAVQYEQIFGLPVPTVPWPLQPLPPDAASRASVGAERPVQFLAIGGCRMEKGIDLLARALEILEPEIASRAIGFLIQGFPNPEVADPEAEQHFKTLQAFAAGHPGVRLLDRAFDPASADYLRLYVESDAVLLPYNREAYRQRISAVMMEALSLGKPTITTEGTSMAILMKQGGAGLTCVDGSVPDLVRAIRELAAGLPEYAAAAAQRRGGWVAYHNPESYLRVLGQLAGASEAVPHSDR